MRYFWFVIALAVLVYGLCVAFAFGWLGDFLPPNQTTGSFGDTFGVVNALFSGAAFVGLFCALVQQRAELLLIKEDRNDTKEQLKLQRDLSQRQEAEIRERMKAQEFSELFSQLRSTIVNASANRGSQTFVGIQYWRQSLARFEDNTTDRTQFNFSTYLVQFLDVKISIAIISSLGVM